MLAGNRLKSFPDARSQKTTTLGNKNCVKMKAYGCGLSFYYTTAQWAKNGKK